MAQNTKGPGFPPSSLPCSASQLSATYLDTNTNLRYACTNIIGVGYVWQLGQDSVLPVTTAPSGTCTIGFPNQQVISTGTQYSCQSGTWAAFGSGSGGSGTVNTGLAGNLAYYPSAGTAVSPLAPKSTIQLPASSQFVFKGDSLTAGAGLTAATQSYPALFGVCTLSGSPLTCTSTVGMSFVGPSATVVNLGVASETLQTALANYATEVHPYCIQATATVPVFLHLEEGINDIRTNSASAATIEGYLTSYWAGAIADGCTVTAATLTPTGDLTTTGEATRLAVNKWIRSQLGLYSFLDDLAQLLNDPTDTTWYQGDGIHYTASGTYQVAKFVNGLWTGKAGFQTMQPPITRGNNVVATSTSPFIINANFSVGANSQGELQIINTATHGSAFGNFVRQDSVGAAAFNYITGLPTNTPDWQMGTFNGSTNFQWYDPANSNFDFMLVADANPSLGIRGSGSSSPSWYCEYVNIQLMGINRNPCLGTITDATKTTADIGIYVTANGTSSNIQFQTTATANSAPSTTQTFDNTGINLPTGETYKVNSVAGVNKTCSTSITAMTVVGGIITSLTCP